LGETRHVFIMSDLALGQLEVLVGLFTVPRRPGSADLRLLSPAIGILTESWSSKATARPPGIAGSSLRSPPLAI